uniref:Uncharacterized protein n=1 Tax=Anopheles atroparvus TaxID=41427 RepID=A0A182J5E2_ANOAO
MEEHVKTGARKCDYEEEEVIANMWVQLLIQFNVYFSGVWVVVTIFFLNCEIPSFAAFLILSFLIQLPLQTYLLLATHTVQHLLPTVVQSITAGTLLLQIATGVPAMRKLSAFRRKQFQLQRWQYMGKTSVTERSDSKSVSVIE